MNNRIVSIMFAAAITCLSLGCSQITTTSLSQKSEATLENQRKENDMRQSNDLNWLLYADPKADANLAIDKQDFTLLAFAGRVTTFPGLDNESSSLQQQCGFRLLANSSDELRSESELSLRKKLYQYAATFNQIVSTACQKNH
ncbi:hypothetical protein [uncultured Paraglaciecola sp.]|uniref:hypothetical protein n=1 Tax=uncultured Paraglaciecola sp. TaxID=1765024 RepID=UPI0030DB483F|tara:strand:+ start:228598 stop:229026 length:429 start_codon:yes stop_codon:yes gene_type:complete